MRAILLWFNILSLLLCSHALAGSAESIVREGNSEYARQQFDKALEKYNSITEKEKLSTGHIDYNKGNCFYQQGDYDKAIEYYNRAVNTSQDNSLAAKSKFNLGNSYFQKAQAKEQAEPKEAIKDYQQGAAFYRQALDMDKNDKQAAENISLTRKKIRELKELVKQQEQQQQQDNQDKQDQQDKPDQQKQDGQGQQDQQKTQEQNGDKDKQQAESEDKQQQDKQGKASQKKDEQQQQQEKQSAQQAQEQEQPEGKQQVKPAEIDPEAAKIIEDEQERKERQMRVIQRQPVKKDW